jgi:hypothetical protein
MDDTKIITPHENDPFSYNFISMGHSKVDEIPTPAASDVIIDPFCHAVGVSLGMDRPKDWNKAYDKIHLITEWAKERSGLKDPIEIVKYIGNVVNSIPTLGAKKIDDLYIHIKMGIKKGKDVS